MIYVIGHIYPTTDIDSVASSILACKYIKKKYNLEAKPFFIGALDKSIKKIISQIKFMPPHNHRLKKDDLFVLVDHNNPVFSINRYDNILGIIDHHEDNNIVTITKFKIIDVVGSCATIIYWLYKNNNIDLDYKDAKLFYYSIISDTFNLELDSVNKKDKLAIMELKMRFKNLPSVNKVLDDLFSSYKNMSLKNRINHDQKILEYKNKKILLINLISFGDHLELNKINKYIDFRFNLIVFVIQDIVYKTSKVQYFGELALYFKNETYNRLLSRKKYFVPHIKNILNNINL